MMDKILRWSLQGLVFTIVFWVIYNLLSGPSLLWQEAVLVFAVYWGVTALVETLYGKVRK